VFFQAFQAHEVGKNPNAGKMVPAEYHTPN
jgi:hypothetical protein